MTRLVWRTDRFIEMPPHRIPIAAELADARHPGTGLRRLPPRELRWKRLVWPVYKRLTDPLFDGFIEDALLRLLRRHWRGGDTYLEIACGDMSLAGRLPKGACFNAFDLSLSELHVRRTLARSPDASLAIAPVERIPLPDACADVLVCSQAFIHFPDFDAAAREIRRVARPGARLLCSVANHLAWMYRVRGAHPDGVQAWSFDGFAQAMAAHGFRRLESHRAGLWVPLPLPTRRALTLPVGVPWESLNTVFFYAFEATDPDAGATA